MAFESLTERLSGVFKKLRGKGRLSEADIKAAMREVRMALLEADVNDKVAKDFCNQVSERAMGQEVMESLTPAQQVVKIVNEELTRLMGGDEPDPAPHQEQGPDRPDDVRPAGQRQNDPCGQARQILPQTGPPPHAGGL